MRKNLIHRLLAAAVAATALLAASGAAAQVKERTLKFAFQNQAVSLLVSSAGRFDPAALISLKSKVY